MSNLCVVSQVRGKTEDILEGKNQAVRDLQVRPIDSQIQMPHLTFS
jgi:hypothetical protein